MIHQFGDADCQRKTKRTAKPEEPGKSSNRQVHENSTNHKMPNYTQKSNRGTKTLLLCFSARNKSIVHHHLRLPKPKYPLVFLGAQIDPHLIPVILSTWQYITALGKWSPVLQLLSSLKLFTYQLLVLRSCSVAQWFKYSTVSRNFKLCINPPWNTLLLAMSIM